MEDKGTVSVVICTYNGEKYLREQLDSIIKQTYPIYEIIASDDGSTDSTLSILNEYAERYPIIKVYENKDHTCGINSNFFNSMRRATGDFIAISDQDDIWELDKIECQVNNIGDNYLVTGISWNFTKDGSFAYNDPRKPNYHLLHLLFSGFPGHTILISRDFFEKLPVEHDIYKTSMYDVDLAIAAAAFDKLTFVDKILVRHRKHSSAITSGDYSECLPSMVNGWHILFWSIKNYYKAKPYAKIRFKSRLAFIEELNPKTKVASQAIDLLKAELADGSLAYIRLTILCIKYRKLMFWVKGGGLKYLIKSVLYPIVQMYNYRYLVK